MTNNMQATGPLFDAINVAVADAIFAAIDKGADPVAAISAAVISAADFGRRNAVAGEWLCRLRVERLIGQSAIAE